MILAYVWSKIFKKLRLSAIVGSQIHKTSKVESGSHIVNSTFDRHSFCGYDCEISYCDIGAFTSIANRVVIGGARHPMEWVAMSPVFYEGRDSVKAKFSTHKRDIPKRTVIGSDVWIGENAIIKQGVHIGTGAVIGMGSVVTKDVAGYSIVAGCPARVIRMRFDEEVIENLLEIKWWEFTDEYLVRYAPYFTDPLRLIEELKPMSKLLERHRVGKSHKAQEISDVVIPTNRVVPLPLQQGKERSTSQQPRYQRKSRSS
jgi:acetyltransferase-like isoleucine patch superfamily enzyme